MNYNKLVAIAGLTILGVIIAYCDMDGALLGAIIGFIGGMLVNDTRDEEDIKRE